MTQYEREITKDSILAMQEQAQYERGCQILLERRAYRAAHPLPKFPRKNTLAEVEPQFTVRS